MDDLFDGFRSVVDTMNPYSASNVALYFAWLVLYSFTAMAIWRSQRRWVRLSCFLVNQVFAVGILITWTTVLALAYAYWIHSLAVLAVVVVAGLWLFRERSPRLHRKARERVAHARADHDQGEGQYGQSAEPGGAVGDRHRGL